MRQPSVTWVPQQKLSVRSVEGNSEVHPSLRRRVRYGFPAEVTLGPDFEGTMELSRQTEDGRG